MFDSVLHPGDLGAKRFGTGTLISITIHAAMFTAIAYISTRPQPLAKVDVIVKFLTARPPLPPPPPPPPKARSAERRIERKPVERKPDTIFASRETPKTLPQPDSQPVDGEEDGVEGGVEGGVPGGVVGGVVGGVLGGVVGSRTTSAPLPKVVPAFVFNNNLLNSPEPHLPDYFKVAHPHQSVKGTYKICVDTSGRVTEVYALTSITGMDQLIIDHLKTTWRYKQEPLPVCAIRNFIFQIK